MENVNSELVTSQYVVIRRHLHQPRAVSRHTVALLVTHAMRTRVPHRLTYPSHRFASLRSASQRFDCAFRSNPPAR